MKLLQDQGCARGGCGKDLELLLSSQARQCQGSAQQQQVAPTHCPGQGLQSRTKCQTVLQGSTKVALKIQIKPAQTQGTQGTEPGMLQPQQLQQNPHTVTTRAWGRVAQLLLHL